MNILKLSSFDLLEELVFISGSEGVVALEHHIEENSQRPHICEDGTVIDFGNDFWSHVGRSPAKSINGLILPTSQTESKINQFELPMTINQDIFCLYISMYYISAMEIE